MQEQVIGFKYDGASKDIKKHQINAKLLASALESFSSLISDADKAINLEDSEIEVKAQAGFVEGSFGVDLVILADPAVLEAIGLIAVGATGSILSILKTLKGETVETIETEEDSDLAKIITSNGSIIQTTKAAATLMDDMAVRSKLDQLIHQPLSDKEISSFKVYPSSLVNAKEDELAFEATTETCAFFKKPGSTQTQAREKTATIANIEFVAANKSSGTKGWRMNYLSKQDTPVKVKDSEFLGNIKTSDAPGIFSSKFKVEMETTIKKKNNKIDSTSYSIIKVISPIIR